MENRLKEVRKSVGFKKNEAARLLGISIKSLYNYEHGQDVPAFGWEMMPPSEGQKNTLEKLGILPDEIDNAGKASLLIDRLNKRRDVGLTTPKQIRFLESRGFKHVGTWQFSDAKKLIDRIAANGWLIPSGINPATYMPE